MTRGHFRLALMEAVLGRVSVDFTIWPSATLIAGKVTPHSGLVVWCTFVVCASRDLPVLRARSERGEVWRRCTGRTARNEVSGLPYGHFVHRLPVGRLSALWRQV